MSTVDQPRRQTVAHTLIYLRRLDKRTDGHGKTRAQIVDLLGRPDLKMDRAARDSREGFIRVERDLTEIESDAIPSGNRILDRFSETLELSRRVHRNDERLDEFEKTLDLRADEQGTRL